MLPLTPTKLGRYEIVDEIGKGAMGVVFLARDPLIGRLVALKTFRIGYSVRDQELDQFRARFIREAQSAGILSHPNIVTIHDVVEESEEGLAFIAMEYVRGTNLKALLQGDQPLALPFVVDVVAQVADALDYAHSHRVIHRDVKPANILITADNRVKITDFGIARLDTSNLTQEGQLLGTPNYMSPEQIQGKEIDHRSDLFALGVVLYEMLTRHKPFQGENLTVVSHRIVYDHFTPPREHIREMPAGIEPILGRALEKEPARRYQRAKEMVDDLRRVAGALLARADLNETQSVSLTAPVLVPPPALPIEPAAAADTPAKTQKPPRPGPLVSPRRIAVAGGAAALLMLLLGAGLLLGLSWSSPAQGRNAKEDADRSRVVTLLHLGSQLLRAGNPAGAVAAYAEAERLAPNPKIHGLRVAAEKKSREAGHLVGVEQEKAAHLLEAQQAMDARRWDDAIAAANAALALDPADSNAQQILASVQTARVRATAPIRTPKKGQPEVVASLPPAAPTPVSTEARQPEPVSQVATLHISFESAWSGASVMVLVGSQKVWQDSIPESGGFLRRNRGGGMREKTVQLATGNADLKVYVTPPNQKAQVLTVSGNFPGGANRHLVIRLPDSKVPTADLR